MGPILFEFRVKNYRWAEMIEKSFIKSYPELCGQFVIGISSYADICPILKIMIWTFEGLQAVIDTFYNDHSTPDDAVHALPMQLVEQVK